MTNIQIKRIYDAPSPSDGYRVLVDRLWPRGVSKENAHIDLWAKDITPSVELRTDFHNGADSWQVFSKKYMAELKNNLALGDFLEQIRVKKQVTLLFAAHDTDHTHAKILMNFLRKKL